MAALVRQFLYPNPPADVFTNGLTNAAYNTANATSLSLPGGNTATVGHTIVSLELSEITNAGRQALSLADAASTVYARPIANFVNALGTLDGWVGPVAANNAGQDIIWTMQGLNGDITNLVALQFSGLDPSMAGALGSTNTQFTNSDTSHTSGTVTPTNANGVLIGMALRSGATWTDDPNFTEIATGRDHFYLGYWLNPPMSAVGLNFQSDIGRDSMSRVIWLPGGATNYSLTVDHAQACGQGQAIAVPLVTAVTHGQAAGNPYDVALLFDAAYVIPVTYGPAATEGQEIPFIYTLPGTDAGAALQGYDISLLAQALVTVDIGQAAASLENITLISLLAIQVDTAGAALQAFFIQTPVTGLPVTSSGGIVNRRRRP